MMTKRKIVILLIALLLLVTVGIVVQPATGSRMGWQTCEQRLPPAIEKAGFHIIQEFSESADAVSLPLSHQLRSVFTRKSTRPVFITGFPESVFHLVLGRDGNARLHCLVRYSDSLVVRIVVRHPVEARQDAFALVGALRNAFPEERIDIEETAPPISR